MGKVLEDRSGFRVLQQDIMLVTVIVYAWSLPSFLSSSTEDRFCLLHWILRSARNCRDPEIGIGTQTIWIATTKYQP